MLVYKFFFTLIIVSLFSIQSQGSPFKLNIMIEPGFEFFIDDNNDSDYRYKKYKK